MSEKEKYYSIQLYDVDNDTLMELYYHLKYNGYHFFITSEDEATILLIWEEETDYIDTILQDREIDYGYINYKGFSKMKSLKQMASEISFLTQSDGIRQYFDDELDTCVYDSSKIFNFFSCCEEVAYYIQDGKYKDAEDIIDSYKI